MTIIGAGPAGLLLARTLARHDPTSVVDVHERRPAGADAGFGVSLSARTLRNLAGHDTDLHRRIMDAAVAQRAIEVRTPTGSVRYEGFEVAAVSRGALLSALHDGAVEAGARVHFGQPVAPGEAEGDVVAVADGAASAHREAAGGGFGTSVRTGKSWFAWLGTPADPGDAAVMAFEETAWGPMALHLYAYAEGKSTAVVEMDSSTFRRAGWGGAVGEDDLRTLAHVFRGPLGGRPLTGATSRWRRFPVVRNERWSAGRTVLLGDAAHTAHFTVGSGTRMALEDALELGLALAGEDSAEAAFALYEQRRRPEVERLQRWAEPSMLWWETFGRRMRRPVEQFGLHFLTRTPAMTYDALRRRCPGALRAAELAWKSPGPDTGPAVLVRPELERDGWWHRMLRTADEIGDGVPVGIVVPASASDPWPGRITLALITGRADFVVARPLSEAQRDRAVAPER
ncbi:FAD-dependent monooxygenase [Actinoplanes sp. LDG1-06]|uniref:FAD-dependent monooxygenase n=1 Tax=Paractinoplanes ovalisporus TaxID=2810368 RepID=A0ABS2AJU8_9ACTN|nr:FAD-dependent monooxygenase [Actinoplanes ovalisporus]MBM2620132.1 FAD-dependent monooxygenase [Actinoplanes ovalisporus]